MGQNSAIEWTDHTFNPWIGCTKVSDGCKFCYAETLMDHRYSKVKWGPQGERVRTSPANWKKPLQWNKQAKAEGRRYRVFCASLADVFEDNEQVREWRWDLWDLIEMTPNLDWLLLTKRPENVIEFTKRWSSEMPKSLGFWPDNIWLGTSVENQATANARIPHLLRIPATVRFLSVEPMLGPVDLEDLAFEAAGPEWAGYNPLVDWVICGGESGPQARPMSVMWSGRLWQQCRDAGIPFFMKQLGSAEAGRMGLSDKKGSDWSEWPGSMRVREFPR